MIIYLGQGRIHEFVQGEIVIIYLGQGRIHEFVQGEIDYISRTGAYI